MKYKKKIVGITLLITAINAHAGFWASTAHSRGNCHGFNESITWNWSQYHWWEVQSLHFKVRGLGPATHHITAFMQYTWRCAALDVNRDPMGIGLNNYRVQGYHFYMGLDGSKVYDVYTESNNCSGYDGWWDKTKANGE